jgi:hypothetical protein
LLRSTEVARAPRIECVDQKCRSHDSKATTPCGDTACSAAEYCYEFVGGVAGSQPSYSCKPLGDCQDCACLNVVASQCTGTASAIKVFCAAP